MQHTVEMEQQMSALIYNSILKDFFYQCLDIFSVETHETQSVSLQMTLWVLRDINILQQISNAKVATFVSLSLLHSHTNTKASKVSLWL